MFKILSIIVPILCLIYILSYINKHINKIHLKANEEQMEARRIDINNTHNQGYIIDASGVVRYSWHLSMDNGVWNGNIQFVEGKLEWPN